MKKTNFTMCGTSLSNWIRPISFTVLFLLAAAFNIKAQDCTLACTGANISVDENCEATLTLNMFLNGEGTSCPEADGFEIIIQDHHDFHQLFRDTFPMNVNPVFWADAGGYIGEQVKIIIKEINPGNPQNSCWSYSLIEDKLPPQITMCPDDELVPCCEPIDITIDYEDYFTDCSKFDAFLVNELPRENDCDEDPRDIVKYIDKIFRAEDENGLLSDLCTLSISVMRLNENLDFANMDDQLLVPNLIFPDSLTLFNECYVDCDEVGNEYDDEYADVNGDGIPDASPEGAGIPYLDKGDLIDPDEKTQDEFDAGEDLYLYPLNSGHESVDDIIKYCSIGVSYEDIDLGTIKCVRKVMRMWTVREWFCNEEFDTSFVQIIEIVDHEGPVLEIPHDFDATTNGYTCEASVYIPGVTGEDNCGELDRVDLRITNLGDAYAEEEDNTDTPVGFFSDWTGGTIKLPEGRNLLEFIGYDECHNDSIHQMYVTVADHTPPVAICDEHTIVSLTNEGTTIMPARSLDDGSYDDCGLKKMVARRMDPGCDCESHYPKFDGFHFMGDYEDHYYYLSHDSVPAHKAFQLAKALGGSVVVLNSSSEDSWVRSEAQKRVSDLSYWIGLSDSNHEGAFEWQNGDPLIYKNWDNGYPDNTDEEDYVISDDDENGQWEVEDAHELYRYVLEVSDPCGWTAYPTFCCDDLGAPLMVSFRAIDKWGNYSDCMVEVEVQDKAPPLLVCPPDLTVLCEFDFDINNLDTYFGKIVHSQEEREEIHVPAEYLCGADTPQYGVIGPSSPHWPHLQLWDGYAIDNCDTDILHDSTDLRDQCGWGLLIRNFKATSVQGTDTSRCWQYITFKPESLFDYNDIIWPDDATIYDCVDSDDTKVSIPLDEYGQPELPTEDECDLVGIHPEDKVYYFNNSSGDACFKLIRTWTVIDWCQFNYLTEVSQQSTPQESDYMFKHLQIIKVHNLVFPEFVNGCGVEHFGYTFGSICDLGHIELTKMATDDCTDEDNLFWNIKIDLHNDGTFDDFFYDGEGNHIDISSIFNEVQYGPEADASGHYPLGWHRIRWTVEDRCGNKSTCDDFFLIENHSAPSPYCIDGLAVDLMPVDNDFDGDPDEGMLVIWASDFDAGTEHPCDIEIILSFSDDPEDTFIEFDCDDAALPQPIEVQIWATIISHQGEFIQAFCVTTINIQDNTGVCDGMGVSLVSIEGEVKTEANLQVQNAEIDLQGSEFAPVMTSETGSYAFPQMPMGGTYKLVAGKNDDPMNGISTLDLVLIQKHILGLQILDSPYKVIASDINKDQMVSASDLVELRRLILGVYDEFQENKSWRFVDRSYEFEDAENPLLENFREEYDIQPLEDNMKIDFMGIKIGDVNLSSEPSELARTEIRSGTETLVLGMMDEQLLPGAYVEVPVYARQDINLVGYQLSMEMQESHMSYSGIRSGKLNVSDENVGTRHLDAGLLTMSWNTVAPTAIYEGEVMFTLLFHANHSGQLSKALELSSEITRAEAYNDQLEVMDISLEFDLQNSQNVQKFELMQNRPNPFSDYTEISFYMPENMEATFSVLNVMGQKVKEVKSLFKQGLNTIRIDRKDLLTKGVFYYSVETDSFSASKRMVLID